jgi:hypothetical protein
MIIIFQKRSDGIDRLAAIWLKYSFLWGIEYYDWISNGLREFWEIATGFQLAAKA